ncbi:MAG: type I secretion system permease/ATPase [Rhodospirillaceae bacterium]
MKNDSPTAFTRAVSACGKALGFAGFVSLFINLLQLVIPLYMMQVFDRVLVSGSMETLGLLSLIATASLLVMAALDAVRGQVLIQVGVWFEQTLGREAFARVIDGAVVDRGSGDALRDVAVVRSFVTGPALIAIFDTPWVLIYLWVMTALHPMLGAIAAVGALLLFGFALASERATRALVVQSGNEARRAAGKLQIAVRSAEVVDALGMLPAVTARWDARNARALDAGTRAGNRAALLIAGSKFTRMFIQLVLLGVGAMLVVQQELTAGVMIAGSIIMSRALAPVEQVIGGWKQVVAARTAFAGLRALFKESPRRPPAMPLPDPSGLLELERVTMILRGRDQAVVKGLSVTIRPGEAVAIIGPSAAGKTTLARLICGIWQPSSGVVRLDGADVFAINRTEMGRHVGYLPQDVELFPGSVRDNIARLGEASAETVVVAARAAGAHDMILRLPKGYDTEVGQGGAYLSGGQRQRIGLARALFGQPRLVVLDEPNAHLDQAGEEALLQAIEGAKQRGATVVMIAHRPGALKVVDRVLLMIDGSLQAAGPRDEVLARFTRPPGAPMKSNAPLAAPFDRSRPVAVAR